MMSKTLSRLGILSSKALTTVLIPSFLLTTLSGRKALNALKPFTKSIFTLSNFSKIIVTMEKKTIMKSKMFQESLRYAFFAKKKPMTTTLITHSAMKHHVMI